MANAVETVFQVQDDFSAAVDRLASAITRLEGKIQGAAPAVDRMGNAMRDAGVDASAFDKQAKALDRTLDSLDGRRVQVHVDQKGSIAAPRVAAVPVGINAQLAAGAAGAEQKLRGLLNVTSALPASMSGVSAAAGNMSTALGSIAGAAPIAAAAVVALGGTVAALIGGFRLAEKLADEGEALKNFAAQIGISERNLAGMTQVFKNAGVDVGTLESAMRILNQKIAEGDPLLKKLGVTARDPFTAFIQLGDAFKRTQGLAVQSTLATELFGRAGTRLIPIFNQGSDALLGNVQAMAQMVAHSDRGREALGRLDDSVDELHTRMESLRVRVVDSMAPALATLAAEALRLGDVFSGLGRRAAEAGNAIGSGLHFPNFSEQAAGITRITDAMGGLAATAARANPGLAFTIELLRKLSGAGGKKPTVEAVEPTTLNVDATTSALASFASSRNLKTIDTSAITAFKQEMAAAGVVVASVTTEMQKNAEASAALDRFYSSLAGASKGTKDAATTAAEAFRAFSDEIDHATKLTPAFLDGLARAFALSGNRLQVFKAVEGDAAAAKRVILELAPAFDPSIKQAKALADAIRITTRAALELVEAVGKIKPPELEPRGERPKPPPIPEPGPLVPVPEVRLPKITEQFDWADRLVTELQDAASRINPILAGMHAGVDGVFSSIESSIDKWTSSWEGVPDVIRNVVNQILTEVARLLVVKTILNFFAPGSGAVVGGGGVFANAGQVDAGSAIASRGTTPSSSAPLPASIGLDTSGLPASIPVGAAPPLTVAPVPPIAATVTFPPLPAFPALPALTVAPPPAVRVAVAATVVAPASIPVTVPPLAITVPDVRADVAVALPAFPVLDVAVPPIVAPAIPPVAVTVAVPTLDVAVPPPLAVAAASPLRIEPPAPLVVAPVPPIESTVTFPPLPAFPAFPELVLEHPAPVPVADAKVATPLAIPVTVPGIAVSVPDVRADVALSLPPIPEIRIEAAATVPDIPAVRVAVDVPQVGVRVPEPLAVAEAPALAVAIPPPLEVAAVPPVAVSVALPPVAMPDIPALTVADSAPVRVDVAVPAMEAPALRVTVPDIEASVPDVRATVTVEFPPLPALAVDVPAIKGPALPELRVAVDAPTLSVEGLPALTVADLPDVRVLAPPALAVNAPDSIPVDAPTLGVKVPTFPLLKVGPVPALRVPPPVAVDAPREIAVTIPPIDLPAIDANVRVTAPAIKALTIDAPVLEVASVPPVRVDLGGTIEAPTLPVLEVGSLPEIAVDVPGAIQVDAPASIPLRVPDLSVTAPDIAAKLDARPLSAALAGLGRVAQGPRLPTINAPQVRIVRATDTVRESQSMIERVTERATESAVAMPDLSRAFAGFASVASSIKIEAPSLIVAPNPIPVAPVPVAVSAPVFDQPQPLAQARTPGDAPPADQRTFVINAINSRDALAEILSPTGSFRRANDRIAELGEA